MNDQEKIRTTLRKVPGFNKVEFLNGGILIDGVPINGLHELEIKKSTVWFNRSNNIFSC